MSVFDAFKEKEKQPDQGWGHSSRFSNSIGETEIIQTLNSSFDETFVIEAPETVIDSSQEESTEIECSAGTQQLCGSQVTDSQVIDVGVRTADQQSQERNEAKVQIIENGSEAVSPSVSSVHQVLGQKQSLKLQTSVNEKGQVLFSIIGNFETAEEKTLLQQLLSKVNYQQLASRANLQTESPVSVNVQPAQTLQSPQASAANNISTSQKLAQLASHIGGSSTPASSTTTCSPANSLQHLLSQARISKEDLVKLIKSSRAGVQATQSNPQGPSHGVKNQQAIIPLVLPGTTPRNVTPNLPRQNVAATSLVDVLQRGSNQCSTVASGTTANLVLNPQQTIDSNLVKVVHLPSAPSTPVKQATTFPNNQIISNLTLASPQKAQATVVGSPQTVTTGNQTIVIPTSGTQYIIVNPGTPVHTANSLSGHVTQPLRIIQTGPPSSPGQVQTLLGNPQFAASQTPAKIVITPSLSPLTPNVDNSSIASSPGGNQSVPRVSNVRSPPIGRGTVNGRVVTRSPKSVRAKQSTRNYFVNHQVIQNRSPTSSVLIRPKNCIIQAGKTNVQSSQHLIRAISQDSIQVNQQLNGGNLNARQTVSSLVVSVNNNSSVSNQGNNSLVEYSDSDSMSNSSEKDSDTVDLSNLQVAPGSKLSNGVIVIPNALSEAIARAKPNQKIPVDNSLKFVKNVTYNIPLKGGSKYFKYDGKFLVPDVDAEGMVGGGVGDRKEKALKGNATGMHMTTPQTSRNFLKAAEAVGAKAFKGGRFWKHSAGPQNSSVGKCTSSNGEIPEESEETAESSSQENNQGKKRPIEDVSDLPPIKDDEIRLVHCKFCGFTSYTVKSCERCHRTFPADTKIEIDKKRFKPDEEITTSTAITKQTFYGKPGGKMTVLIHTAQATKRDGSVVNVSYVNHGRRVNLEGKSYRSPSVIRGAKQTRKAVNLEPVTISISSDEEEEPVKKTVPGSTATGSISSSTGSATTATESATTATGTATMATGSASLVTRSVTPAAGQQSVSTTKGSEPSAEEDDIGQLLDSMPQTKRPTSPILQGSRMIKMEDEEGNTILVRKSLRRKSPTQPRSSSPTVSSISAPNTSKSTASAMDVSSVDFIAEVIRIGSVPAVAIEPIVVAEDSITFFVEFEETTERFVIKPDELQQCLFCLENRPVIFLKTTVDFARKVRELLKLETKDGGHWFDPDDAALKYQFITFVMKDLGSLTYVKLNSVLQKYPEPKGQSFPFILKMTGQEALVYLKEVRGEGENGQVESTTHQTQLQPSSPPAVKILFTGPVVKLITFPPPPAPGGIQVTNEDLSCLEEGEFLNDVIIDFYLKYLFLDVLSDRDRERTHIFSSFFFKRLTQRQGQRGLEADMADKTPAEKKHARVKNWTKKVDLFEKDFIFVPINEHSHWFLAVICFPGLQASKQITYVPKKTNLISQSRVTIQMVSSPAAKIAGAGGPEKTTEPGKEPDNSLKGYKIPKVAAKNGEDAKTESESNDGEVKSAKDGEKEKVDGERSEEPMDTEDLSDAQKKEIEEDSEETMDTSERQSQSKSEDGETDKEKLQPQSDSSSQETVKSENESQVKSETQTKNESESQTKLVVEKPVKISFRTPLKDLRGREVTAEELKDPSIMKTCTFGCRQPCILVFDSLAGQTRSRIVAILKEYLQVEWETKKKTPYKEKIRGCTATKVPQQTNFSDCGVYLLQYVESFFEDPIQDFAIPLKPLTGWFTEERVTAKRKEIKELVMKLKEIQEQGKS